MRVSTVFYRFHVRCNKRDGKVRGVGASDARVWSGRETRWAQIRSDGEPLQRSLWTGTSPLTPRGTRLRIPYLRRQETEGKQSELSGG